MVQLLKCVYGKMFLYSTKAAYRECKDFIFIEFWLLGIILLMLLLFITYDLIIITYYTIWTIVFMPLLLLLRKSGVSMWRDVSGMVFACAYEVISDLIELKEIEFDDKT